MSTHDIFLIGQIKLRPPIHSVQRRHTDVCRLLS